MQDCGVAHDIIAMLLINRKTLYNTDLEGLLFCKTKELHVLVGDVQGNIYLCR